MSDQTVKDAVLCICGTNPQIVILDDLECIPTDEFIEPTWDHMEMVRFIKSPDPVDDTDYEGILLRDNKAHLKSCQPWKRKKKGRS